MHNTENDHQHKLWDLGDVTRYPLVEVSITGRLCVWWGMYGNSLYLSQFCCEPKLALENKTFSLKENPKQD